MSASSLVRPAVRSIASPARRRQSITVITVIAVFVALLSAFTMSAPAQAAENDPIAPGTIYGIDQSAPHNIYSVDPVTGALTVNNTVTTAAPWLNGLAIDYQTDSFWSIVQLGTGTAGFVPTIYKVVASTGVQTTFTADPVRGPTDPDGLIVMGALDQTTGIYYYGRVLNSIVYIQAFDARAGVPVEGIIARVSVGNGANGDFAFVDGTLYVAAQGGLYRVDEPLPSTGDTVGVGPLLATTAVAPIGDGQLNSAAFGNDGYLYLSAATGTSRTIYQVNPASGAIISSTVLTPPTNTVADFASTSAPYTIELQKNLPDGRVFASDQFSLSITGGDVFGGNVGTTTGTEPGLQDQDPSEIAGRVLAIPGTTYTIAEQGVAGAELGNYTSSWSCVDDQTVVASGSGTTGTVTVPNNGGVGANIVCTITNSALALSYTVEKSASVTSAGVGDVVDYTIAVTNTGAVAYTDASPASFVDDLSQVVDDATYNNDATNGATVAGSTLSWAGPLAVGATTSITYSVTVNDPDVGDKVLTNTVTPDGPGGECAPDEECTTSTPVRGYTVTKSVSAETASPGDAVTYAIAVTNTGIVDYTDADPATFTDDLGEVLTGASYNDDADGGAVVTGDILSWSAPLAVGETLTVTYSVTVKPGFSGTLRNVVVTPPEGGCDPQGAFSDSNCLTTTTVPPTTPTPPDKGLASTGSGFDPTWPTAFGVLALLGSLTLLRRSRRPGQHARS